MFLGNRALRYVVPRIVTEYADLFQKVFCKDFSETSQTSSGKFQIVLCPRDHFVAPDHPARRQRHKS